MKENFKGFLMVYIAFFCYASGSGVFRYVIRDAQYIMSQIHKIPSYGTATNTNTRI